MLDIKKIRQEPDFYKEKLATRGVKPEEIDEVIALDKSGGNCSNKLKQ